MNKKHKLVITIAAAIMAVSPLIPISANANLIALAAKTKTKKITDTRGGRGDGTRAKVGIKPQDNLYLAVNSKWMKKAKIPADAPTISSTREVNTKINKELQQDMAAFASGKKTLPNVPDFAKAVAVYKQAEDMKKRNRDGAKPIMDDLAKLEGIKDFADFNTKAADLFNNGMDLPFTVGVYQDAKNAQKNALYFDPTDTFLPDANNYSDPNSKQPLEVLKKQSIKLLTMAGVSKTKATNYTESALKYEHKLAKTIKSAASSSDSPSSYNPVSDKDFTTKFKDFDIKQFLHETVGQESDQIIVNEPAFLKNINKLLNPADFEELKGWLIVKFINNAAGDLSQKFQKASFPFTRALTGQKSLPTAKMQAFEKVNDDFDDVIGIYYGQTYFGTSAKKDVTSMVKEILQIYKERLEKNNWLSAQTKQKAIAKLQAMTIKVGYPDKVPAYYDNLTITPKSQGGTLYASDRALNVAMIKDNLSQLSKPVDRSIWHMAGDEDNAMYNSSTNDITLPAGGLQAPFYSKKQSHAANLGSIGTTIDHEISHAFDNNGAKFDEFGSLNNWWTKKDYAEFQKRVKAETKLFNGIKYGPAKVNGKQTVPENIADQGGLSVAIEAAKQEHVSLKELFISYARSARVKTTNKTIKNYISAEEHAPNPCRINVQAQCQNDFYKVFKVKPGDGMWLAPKKRVHIW
ncbi:M13 family metallopeptidase [Lactobacillus sp. ESL0791]|uniref:M13-type metalloendopeptidase n=1 Tax=Lactobacillus sp. ESL0791 TaxID=2983234 RepID=UPI0023FA397A|nr:M13 family metallopeptidase [Lactobacillus sp. ESL0791]MDF7637914.1 M13 family metallopeptidase [Lactobacillus sp. ESL0791]